MFIRYARRYVADRPRCTACERNLALRAIDLKRAGAPPEKYENLFAEAETRMNRMFSGFERLVAAHPENNKYRRDLSTAYGNLGMIYRETGRLEKSRRILETDLQKRETVAALDRSDRELQADLSETLLESAQIDAALKNFPVAFARFAHAVNIYDRLIDLDPTNIEFRRMRFDTENYYADALGQNGDHTAALEKYRFAFEKLKKGAPAEIPYFEFAEGATREKIGDVSLQQGKFTEAAAAFRVTLELWNKPESVNSDLSRSPERIDWVREKLSKTAASGARRRISAVSL